MGGASRNVCPVAVEIVMMIAGEHLCTTQRAETNVEFLDCPVKAMRVAGGGTDGLWLGVLRDPGFSVRRPGVGMRSTYLANHGQQPAVGSTTSRTGGGVGKGDG